MRKFSLILTLVMLVCCLCLSAFAAETVMRWDEVVATNGGGYPRMAERADGTLILTTGSGANLHSTDRGVTWTKQSKSALANASKSATFTTADGDTYEFTTAASGDTTSPSITRANLQPFVVSDGTVLLGYRFHSATGARYTDGDPFYTSIRVISSADGGVTFNNDKNEVVLIENVATASNGYWEPFFVQVDEDTVYCYYADDLSDGNPATQRIAYVRYDVSDKTWDTENHHVAIYRGDELSTRDGMPMVTKLIDGTYAMVVEVQDFASWNKAVIKDGFFGIGAEYTDSTFVVGLSLSDDGVNWDDPIPVFGPTDLAAGNLCAAPSIATLPDGRVIITCQTEEGYTGEYGYTYDDDGNRVSNANTRVMAAAISDAPITKDTVITAIDPKNPKADGAAVGFTRLEGVLSFEENQYCIWNAAFASGNDVYIYGGAATNTSDGKTTDAKTLIWHLTAFANANEAASHDDVTARAGDNTLATVYGTAENGTVTLGVPAGATASDVHVYRMDNGVYLTEMDTAVANGKITFTDNGGYYAVSDTALVTYGDANDDGTVSLKDVLRIVRQSVSAVDGTDVAACDVDSSLTVDVQDAMAVIRSILG
ncbi:MAG: hypothetical protein E7598_01440 [Ruminococcaceae bacterium]|nr:hypothetical protein [Oscillospiraceae bacterium]